MAYDPALRHKSETPPIAELPICRNVLTIAARVVVSTCKANSGCASDDAVSTCSFHRDAAWSVIHFRFRNAQTLRTHSTWQTHPNLILFLALLLRAQRTALFATLSAYPGEHLLLPAILPETAFGWVLIAVCSPGRDTLILFASAWNAACCARAVVCASAASWPAGALCDCLPAGAQLRESRSDHGFDLSVHLDFYSHDISSSALDGLPFLAEIAPRRALELRVGAGWIATGNRCGGSAGQRAPSSAQQPGFRALQPCGDGAACGPLVSSPRFATRLYTANPEMVVSSLGFKLHKNISASLQLHEDVVKFDDASVRRAYDDVNRRRRICWTFT